MSDLISRQAATSIPMLPKEHRKSFKDMDEAFETGWNEALSCVNMLPSADRPTGEWTMDEGLKGCPTYYLCSVPSAGRPTGKWLKRHTIGDVDFAYCSKCGEPIMHGCKSPLWSYCPNCGAKMEV